MPTYLENLKTRRDTIATYLAGLTPGSSTDDLPTIQGEGVNPQAQQKIDSLMKHLVELEELIRKAEQDDAADGGNVGIHESFERP